MIKRNGCRTFFCLDCFCGLVDLIDGIEVNPGIALTLYVGGRYWAVLVMRVTLLCGCSNPNTPEMPSPTKNLSVNLLIPLRSRSGNDPPPCGTFLGNRNGTPPVIGVVGPTISVLTGTVVVRGSCVVVVAGIVVVHGNCIVAVVGRFVVSSIGVTPVICSVDGINDVPREIPNACITADCGAVF